MSIERLIEEALKLEEVGRLLSFQRSNPIGTSTGEYPHLDDGKLIKSMRKHVDAMYDSIYEYFAEMFRYSSEYELLQKFDNFRYAFGMVAEALAEKAEKNTGVRRGDLVIDLEEEYALRTALEELEEASERLFGKRCTWLFGNTDKYTFSAALNDLTACFHRAIELASSFSVEREEGLIFIHRGAGELEQAICESFEMATRYMYDFYVFEDARELSCHAFEGKVWLRVGSASGHATHIDLKQGKLEYYDVDVPVNATMKKLWERLAGLKCEQFSDGLTCYGVNEKNARLVGALAAAATSMDYRVSDPGAYWDWESIISAHVELVMSKLREIAER